MVALPGSTMPNAPPRWLGGQSSDRSHLSRSLSEASLRNQNATNLAQLGATWPDLRRGAFQSIQLPRASWVAAGWVRARLKIRVSVVQFHPWPPSNALIFQRSFSVSGS